MASLQALYTDKNSPIKSSYRVAVQSYGVDPVEVDFFNRETIFQINEATNRSTRGLIPYAVLPQEIYGAKIFMLSSLFFKGQWKVNYWYYNIWYIHIKCNNYLQFPFNTSSTRTEPFYDEKGAVITQVSMMVQEGNFAYVTNIEGLDGYVLELPYGEQNRLSMIVVLPKRGFNLNDVARNLKDLTLSPLLQRLAKFSRDAPEDSVVEVLMPKFTTSTDFSLKKLLQEVGEFMDMSEYNI